MAQTLTQKIKKNVLKKAQGKADQVNGTIVREEPTNKADSDLFKGVLEAYDKHHSLLANPVDENQNYGSPIKSRMQFGRGSAKFANSLGAKSSLLPVVPRKAVLTHGERLEPYKTHRAKVPEEDGKSIFRKFSTPVIFFIQKKGQ
jgi:hypothetical protein